MDNNMSYTPGDDKFAMASERNNYPPPSYDYGMEMTESPISIHAAPQSRAVAVHPPEKYVMRDEERYPQVVDVPAGLEHYTPAPGESSAASITTLSPLTRNLAGLDSQKPEVVPVEETEKPARTIWGIPRRRFFMIATGIAVLAIGGIIIGVVLGVVKKNEEQKYPAITASGVFTGANNTDWQMHIVHTNMTTGVVNVKHNNGTGSWSEQQPLDLSIMPAVDASMSALSVLGNDGNIYLHLFYLTDHDIVMANMSCIDASCTTLSNEVISKGISYPIDPDSALDSVYINSTGGFRVFYHNTDKYVTQLASPGDGSWDSGAAISGKAVTGSSICATLLGDSGMINVMYVDDRTETLFNVQSDLGRWRNPSPVVSTELAHWNPKAAMASSYESGTDILSAFFTGSDKLIYQLSATNASSEEFAKITRGEVNATSTSGFSTAGWNQTAYRDLSWAPSDATGAEIASLGWDDQSRFFRLISGDLAESIEINGVWSAHYV